MTTYTLISWQRVPNNPSGPSATPVVVSGSPRRGSLTFSVSGTQKSMAQASLWATTGETPYGYFESVPVAVMTIPPGAPQTITKDVAFDFAYQPMNLFGQVDLIDPSQAVSATLTLRV